MVHAARRVRSRRADRRPYRLGAQRRLARRLPERDGGLEVLRRIADEGTPPVTVRLVDWADEEGARFGRSLFGSSAAAARWSTRTSCASSVTRRHRAARRARRARRRPRPRARGAAPARERRRLPGAPHRAGAGARVDGPAAGRRARHVRRRAPPHHLARPGRARRLDADGPAPRRARGRGEARARDPRRSPSGPATARSAPSAASSASRGSSRRWSRRPSSCSTSGTWTPTSSRRCSRQAKEARERFAAEENVSRRVGADLVDRADPVPRAARRARRRGDPGGGRRVAPAAKRPAPRRGRGGARGRARR